MQTYQVAVLRGGPDDDSGPELMDAALHVLKSFLSDRGGPRIDFIEVEAGTHCAKTRGDPLPQQSLDTILALKCAFKAPTAGGKVPAFRSITPTLRKALNTYANITPCRSYKGVKTALKPGIDMVMVRENSEGFQASPSFRPVPGVSCSMRIISQLASQRIARVAFKMAQDRRRQLTVCASTSGVCDGDLLFIESCRSVASEFPEVQLEVRKPDALNGILVINPGSFDVVVAPNEWGMIISDAMAATTGSVGLGPRANLGDGTALFEPIHGTAPGKAGKGTVNPVGQILAGKMMLEWFALQHNDEGARRVAGLLEQSVTDILDEGRVLTVDLGGKASTREIAEAIVERGRRLG